MDRHVPVTFMPSGASTWVPVGTTVLEAARSAGVMMAAPCGGRGICGSCGVRVLVGDLAEADEEELRGLARAPKQMRLACRARVSGAVTLRPVITSAKPKRAFSEASPVVVGIDLGTTNVACMSVEADGGRQVGSAVVPNGQQPWGADVISRLSAAVSGDAQALRSAVEVSVAEACRAVVGSATVERAVLAGNTAMTALLTGSDVSSLTAHPFAVPPLPDTLASSGPIAAALGEVEVVLAPPLVAFIGGDALAGLVHTGMLYAEHPTMLLDLGTNAEIVLFAGGRLYAASAAAGPAFEGAGVECGGPAVAGAVSGLSVSEDAQTTAMTIDGSEPLWLSGAGVISVVAALRRQGHLAADGTMSVDGPWSSRFFVGEDGVLRFRIQGDVTFSQLDVRAVQLAKAAVAVGIQQVLLAAGIRGSELARLYVAGAFGGAISTADLSQLGVVPQDVAEVAQFVGNAALLGAVSMAMSPKTLDNARSLVPSVMHVDLVSVAGFSDSLMRNLELAHSLA